MCSSPSSEGNEADIEPLVQPTGGGRTSCVHHDVEGTPELLSIEDLPPELRCHILSQIGDLRTLRSLVRASPTYHAQYRLDRDVILRNCLALELDGLHPDAHALVKSRVHVLGRCRPNTAITRFLEDYRCWLKPSQDTGHPSPYDITPGLARWLASFHLSVALPLAGKFCRWALENLEKAGGGGGGAGATAPATAYAPGSAASRQSKEEAQEAHFAADDLLLTLSRSERLRLLRALYRYETYHHLFGQNKGCRQGDFQEYETVEIFFGLFEPWETEEVGCIDFFIRKWYKDVFNEVKVDLHPDSPRFDGQRGGGDPNGSFELDMLWNTYMEGTIARGLKLAARILTCHTHEQLVTTMSRSIITCDNIDASLASSLGQGAQEDRRDVVVIPGYVPSEKDAAEGSPMAFVGDSTPPNDPPLAWVLLWEGKYANIFGQYIPEPLKEWGWVLWDERRLVEAGVTDLVASQWENAAELLEEIKDCFPRLEALSGGTAE